MCSAATGPEPRQTESVPSAGGMTGQVRSDGVPAPRDSLTVVDNRTGRSYEIPIVDGTVRALDFRAIRVLRRTISAS